MNFNKKQGFTLIELLVVIAIIAVLVAFSVANFVGARSRARDVRKKSELQQVKNALRLYYNDYNTYPGPDATKATNTFNGCDPNGTTACGSTFSAGANVYMKLLPNYSPDNWYYQQIPLKDDFCLWSTLENKSDGDITTSQNRCDSVCNGLPGAYDYVLCAD